MLAIPEKGLPRSVKKNNTSPKILGDWVEASLLFHDNTISRSDFVSILIEQQVCGEDSHDVADQIAISAWEELNRRKSWSNAAPFLRIKELNITDTDDWRNDILRAFFLILSLKPIYPDWASKHRDPVLQGELFERVVEQLCLGIFPEWGVYRAGWSPESSLTIEQIVADLCERLNCRGHADLERWVPDQTKDGGLDIVCYREFPDMYEATPTFFIQCASGADWRNKIQTPNPSEWQRYLDSAVQPGTGIAIPFVMSNEEICLAGFRGQTIVLDRLRLLYAAHRAQVVLSDELVDSLIAWLMPLEESLPQIA